MTTPNLFIAAVRESFVGSAEIYTQGSCIGFFLILKAVYPQARPYWSNRTRHMIAKIGDRYYDIRGEVKNFKSYKLHWQRIASHTVCVAKRKKSITRVFSEPIEVNF